MTIAGLIFLFAMMMIVSWLQPSWLSDQNSFLLNFVNHELLAFLGVIVTITLASTASLHIELNRLEEGYNEGFSEARSAIKAYAYLMIWLLFAAIGLVIVKPILADGKSSLQAIINSLAIMIVVLNLLTLVDITRAAFSIPPKNKIAR